MTIKQGLLLTAMSKNQTFPRIAYDALSAPYLIYYFSNEAKTILTQGTLVSKSRSYTYLQIKVRLTIMKFNCIKRKIIQLIILMVNLNLENTDVNCIIALFFSCLVGV